MNSNVNDNSNGDNNNDKASPRKLTIPVKPNPDGSYTIMFSSVAFDMKISSGEQAFMLFVPGQPTSNVYIYRNIRSILPDLQRDQSYLETPVLHAHIEDEVDSNNGDNEGTDEIESITDG